MSKIKDTLIAAESDINRKLKDIAFNNGTLEMKHIPYRNSKCVNIENKDGLSKNLINELTIFLFDRIATIEKVSGLYVNHIEFNRKIYEVEKSVTISLSLQYSR